VKGGALDMETATEGSVHEIAVRIPIRPFEIQGLLALPSHPLGVVLFAEGSAASGLHPHDRVVAEALWAGRLGTLVMDLLTPEEERIDDETHLLRFDVDLLAGRLIIATDWLRQQPIAHDLGFGYFATSTGAGVALVAASERSTVIRAVVSCSGRPDLAGPALVSVHAPTLLVVGAEDHLVLHINRSALQVLPSADKGLQIIPDATHSFEEPGAIDRVAELTRDWFRRYVPTDSSNS
jgi:dienelactone hydrolase